MAEEQGSKLVVDVVGDTTGFSRGLQRKINEETRAIRAKVRAQIDTTGLRAQARAAAKEASRDVRLRVLAEVDATGLQARARAALKPHQGKVALKVRVVADTSGLRKDLAAKAKVAAADLRVRVGVDVDSNKLRRELAVAVGEAGAHAGPGATAKLDVDADVAGAAAKVEAFRRTQESRPISVPVRTRGEGAGPGKGGAGGGKGGGGGDGGIGDRIGASSLIGLAKLPVIGAALSVAAAGAVQLAGGLVAVVAAAAPAAGVLAAIPAAAVVAVQAVGTVKAAMSGIGAAVKAVHATQSDAAKQAREFGDAQQAAADRVTSAQQSFADAQRRLADAQLLGPRQVAAATRALAGSEVNLKAAQRDSRKAQIDLNLARQDARRNVEDLNRSLKASALDEADAALSVAEARKNMTETFSSVTATDLEKQRAKLGYDQAIARQEDVRTSTKRLAVDTKAANKLGVEGSAQVVDARQAVADSARGEQQATQAVRDAQFELGRTQAGTAREMTDAAKGVTAAQRDMARAVRDQAQATADGSASAQALKKAYEDLSPAGQRFAEFLNNTVLKKLGDLKKASQDALLPGMQLGISRTLGLLPVIEKGMTGTGKVIGDAFATAGDRLANGPIGKNLPAIMDNNTAVTKNMADAGLSLVDVIGRLVVAAQPLLLTFSGWVRDGAAWLEGIVKTKDAGGELGAMFDKAGTTLAQFGRIGGNVLGIIGDVLGAALPAGELLMTSFEGAVGGLKDLTGSAKGQNDMKQWFLDAVPTVKEIGSLIVRVAQGLIHLSHNKNVPVLIKMIREKLLPAVERLLETLGGEFATKLVSFLAKAADLIEKLTADGGGLNGLMDTLNAIVGVLSKALDLPGADKIVVFFGILAGAAVGLRLTRKAFAGIADLVKTLSKYTGVTSLLQAIKNTGGGTGGTPGGGPGTGGTPGGPGTAGSRGRPKRSRNPFRRKPTAATLMAERLAQAGYGTTPRAAGPVRRVTAAVAADLKKQAAATKPARGVSAATRAARRAGGATAGGAAWVLNRWRTGGAAGSDRGSMPIGALVPKVPRTRGGDPSGPGRGTGRHRDPGSGPRGRPRRAVRGTGRHAAGIGGGIASMLGGNALSDVLFSQLGGGPAADIASAIIGDVVADKVIEGAQAGIGKTAKKVGAHRGARRGAGSGVARLAGGGRAARLIKPVTKLFTGLGGAIAKINPARLLKTGSSVTSLLSGVGKAAGKAGTLSKAARFAPKLLKGGALGIAAGLLADPLGNAISGGKKGWRGAAGGAVKGGATGAGIGATVGSIIPGVGTVVGGAVGGVLGAGIGAIKGSGIGLDDVKKATTDAFGWVKDQAAAAKDWAVGTFGDVKNGVKNAAGKVADTAADAFGWARTQAASARDAAIGTLRGLKEGAVSAIAAGGSAVAGGARTAFSWLGDQAAKAHQDAVTVFGTLRDGVTASASLAGKAAGKAGAAAATAFGWLTKEAAGARTKVEGFFTGLRAAITALAQDPNAGAEAGGKGKDKAAGPFDWITVAAQNIAQNLTTIAVSLPGAILHGIWSGATGIKENPFEWLASKFGDVAARIGGVAGNLWSAVTGHATGGVAGGPGRAAGLGSTRARKQMAAGGVNPGYAPGVDSLLSWTSPGEGWVVPQAVRGLARAMGVTPEAAIGWINTTFSQPGLRFAGGGLTPGGRGNRLAAGMPASARGLSEPPAKPGLVIEEGAIVQHNYFPEPEQPTRTLNMTLRTLAAQGMFGAVPAGRG